MTLESELLDLLPDSSQYDRDELVQVLSSYIKELVNKNVGKTKIDLHFAQLAQEEETKYQARQRAYLQERVEELEAQLGLDTASNEVRHIISSLAREYWEADGGDCLFCGNEYDEHRQDCLTVRARKVLKR